MLLAGLLTSSSACLQSLSLSGNPQKSAAAFAALGSALETNRTLQTIELARTGMGAEGARVFCAGLARNSCLTAIDLSDNGMGREGVLCLCDALEENTSLVSVGLSGNAQRGDDASYYERELLHAALAANRRASSYQTHLLSSVSPPTRVQLHICGAPRAGKSSIAAALAALGKAGGDKGGERGGERGAERGGEGKGRGKGAGKGGEDTAEEGAEAEVEAPLTRGVQARSEAVDGRRFHIWEYGGVQEFQLAHWRTYDRAMGLRLPAAGVMPAGSES